MKKLIGVLGVALIAMALFLSTNTINTNDVDLASLMSMNTANAECEGLNDCLRNPGYVCILLHPTDPTLDCETPEGWAWFA